MGLRSQLEGESREKIEDGILRRTVSRFPSRDLSLTFWRRGMAETFGGTPTNEVYTGTRVRTQIDLEGVELLQ